MSRPFLVWGTVKTQNVLTVSLLRILSITILHGHPAILLKSEPHIAFQREREREKQRELQKPLKHGDGALGMACG